MQVISGMRQGIPLTTQANSNVNLPALPTLAPFYRAAALAKRWSTSKATIWRMRTRGDLPEPLKLSAGLVGWTGEQVAEVEARRTTEAADRAATRRGQTDAYTPWQTQTAREAAATRPESAEPVARPRRGRRS